MLWNKDVHSDSNVILHYSSQNPFLLHLQIQHFLQFVKTIYKDLSSNVVSLRPWHYSAVLSLWFTSTVKCFRQLLGMITLFPVCAAWIPGQPHLYHPQQASRASLPRVTLSTHTVNCRSFARTEMKIANYFCKPNFFFFTVLSERNPDLIGRWVVHSDSYGSLIGQYIVH